MTDTALGIYLENLRIPEGFKAKDISDKDVATWNRTARKALKEIQSSTAFGQASAKSSAKVLACMTEFSGPESWLEEDTRQIAHETISSFSTSTEVIRLILEDNVKPLFLSSPHPHLNLTTGRTLPRGAGGPMAAQDYYGEQSWKSSPGIANVVTWCIRQIPPENYEQVWHLLIPPVMTFLDDYQAAYKLRGVRLVSEMLKTVPPILLKRTGVGELLVTSLDRALVFLHDEKTPSLLRETVPVSIDLVSAITPPGSEKKFDQLCHILGESIIGNLWVYAGRELDAIEASMDVLPVLVHALGIGTARYLKALIPQCVHCIAPNELSPPPASLQIAALRALLAVIKECQPRMYRWKATIIEGVGKCWVSHYDNKDYVEGRDSIRALVRDTFHVLSESCPSVIENEYAQLLKIEPKAFKPVISVSEISTST